ncbi:MAG: hypothetical protein WDO16_19265 [Bacteroidota bacterium]
MEAQRHREDFSDYLCTILSPCVPYKKIPGYRQGLTILSLTL